MKFPDVSHWQGDVNFDVMKSKTDYIIFKASQGGFPDPKITRNKWEAKRVGLPYGLYHFYDDRVSPSRQAETFASLASGAVELWCDWESSYSSEFAGLKNVVSFMERVEELTGKSVGMYTGYYWFLGNSSAITNASQYRYLADRPLWLAWYTNDFTPKEIERVRIPKPWTKMEIWQYGTPSLGAEMGAESIEIDMNLRVGNTLPESVVPSLEANFAGVRVEYRKV